MKHVTTVSPEACKTPAYAGRDINRKGEAS
jgi:hypothetical protein